MRGGNFNWEELDGLKGGRGLRRAGGRVWLESHAVASRLGADGIIHGWRRYPGLSGALVSDAESAGPTARL